MHVKDASRSAMQVTIVQEVLHVQNKTAMNHTIDYYMKQQNHTPTFSITIGTIQTYQDND